MDEPVIVYLRHGEFLVPSMGSGREGWDLQAPPVERVAFGAEGLARVLQLVVARGVVDVSDQHDSLIKKPVVCRETRERSWRSFFKSVARAWVVIPDGEGCGASRYEKGKADCFLQRDQFVTGRGDGETLADWLNRVADQIVADAGETNAR